MSALEIQDTFQPYYSGREGEQPVLRKSSQRQIDSRDVKPKGCRVEHRPDEQSGQSRPQKSKPH